MLQQGVIQPAKSPWASNLVLVKKKDGSLRCCVDYRQLNSLTRKDAYPLPRTDMCLDAMSGTRCMFVRNQLQARRLVLQKQLEFAEMVWVRVSFTEAFNVCICLCYHPPKQRYTCAALISTFNEHLTELLALFPHDTYVVTGDLNQLNYSSLMADFGLSQIVSHPTSKGNILDIFLTNRPDIFNRHVAKSVLKSDHYAVYINFVLVL